MFEEFKKITIKGGYFEQPTEFSLFTPNQTLSIIYGRNGTSGTTADFAARYLLKAKIFFIILHPHSRKPGVGFLFALDAGGAET